MTRASALMFSVAATRRTMLEAHENTTSDGSNDLKQRSGHGAGGGTGPPYMSESNFDTNMVIILAALLCALICALGLNSVVRCALRCSRRVVFESGDDVPVRLTNTGMKRRALRSLPVTFYAGGGRVGGSEGVGEGGASSTDCAICLAEFSEGDKVRVLPNCKHVFHVKCVDKWLLSHSSCPTCRQCLLQNNGIRNFHPSVEEGPSNLTDFSQISASTHQIHGVI